ncbi:hypothetical protein N1851_032747 [Merluccius polli]|uniref:Alkylated DNA repair protein AlkB homologue 8 N-terminal domain-containing protein n=1 Tax=Merluccius polli TaxID=89951 RepID=A0AA47NNP4_MERPO|nr:hypothetical protein N1851_032747 [Merluccius polli]
MESAHCSGARKENKRRVAVKVYCGGPPQINQCMGNTGPKSVFLDFDQEDDGTRRGNCQSNHCPTRPVPGRTRSDPDDDASVMGPAWSHHTGVIVKAARQRLFFLRRLKEFGMDSRILTIESILTASPPAKAIAPPLTTRLYMEGGENCTAHYQD